MSDVSFNFHTKPNQDKVNFLYSKIYTQGIQMYGENIYFLPFTINKDMVDKVFVEQQNKDYNEIYKIRMYPEDVTRMEGNGDLFSKFGITVSDEVTLYTTRIDFHEKVTGTIITKDNFNEVEALSSETKPKISDLIYIPFWQSIFEITFVEDQENLILGNSFWKLICKKWRSDVDTVIELDVTGSEIDTDVLDYLNNFTVETYVEDKDFSQTGSDMSDAESMNKEFENIGNEIRDDSEGSSDLFDNWN
jgi:Virus neck protein